MEIKKIACIGAGLIGHSWATIFSTNGFDVVLEDVNNLVLQNAVKQIKSNVAFLMLNDLIDQKKGEEAFTRITTKTNVVEAVKEADYVQESVPETYEAKKKIFRELDANTREDAILASSTSALLMTEIQKSTTKPGRCITAHPWNPPHLIPLVEIVPGEATTQETVKTTHDLLTRVGKAPIVVKKEVPGFVANRLQAALLREALDLVDKGVASVEDVDRAVWAGPGLRWAIMGPFLTHHLGHKGMERFFDVLGYSYSIRWKTMETWTSLPYSAAKKAIDGVWEMGIVRSKSMDELIAWRDEKLVKLLRVQKE